MEAPVGPTQPCKQKRQVALITRSLLQAWLTSAAFLLKVCVAVFIFAIWKIMSVCLLSVCYH